MTPGSMAGHEPRRETLHTNDGVRLDARVEGPIEPACMVVWCHPHPLMGGSMFAPLMNAVTDGLVDTGVGVLRFDFRGVGSSTGTHGAGIAEVADVAAAVARASRLAPTVVLAGWSFGALVALRYITAHPDQACVAVAPPIDDVSEFTDLSGRGVRFIVAIRDQAVDNAKVEEVAESIGAPVTRVPTDHLFIGRSAAVVDCISAVCGRA